MTDDIIAAVVILVAIHLLGGAFGHHRARRHGMRPDLFYTYGAGWWGSISLPGGFRVGHRLTAGMLLTLVVILVVIVAVVRARLGHYA